MKPYSDTVTGEMEVVRTFDETIDPIELMWHRDDEARIVEAIGETDWLIQLEDSLPVKMTGPIMVPRHEWHRVIKGTGQLTVLIKKL